MPCRNDGLAREYPIALARQHRTAFGVFGIQRDEQALEVRAALRRALVEPALLGDVVRHVDDDASVGGDDREAARLVGHEVPVPRVRAIDVAVAAHLRAREVLEREGAAVHRSGLSIGSHVHGVVGRRVLLRRRGPRAAVRSGRVGCVEIALVIGAGQGGAGDEGDRHRQRARREEHRGTRKGAGDAVSQGVVHRASLSHGKDGLERSHPFLVTIPYVRRC